MDRSAHACVFRFGLFCPRVGWVFFVFHHVFLCAFFSTCFPAVFGWRSVWRTVRQGVADSPRGVLFLRTVCGVSTDGPLLRVQYWWFMSKFRIVHRSPADSPPRPHGRSARCLRIVRLAFRKVAKSFASCVFLSLWDCLGFVPKVGRSIVITYLGKLV
jgi:hypothetical protein